MTQYNLGHVVGATGATGATGASGADGASVWNTSTAPTYANSKYTFTISNLSGRSGVTIAVNDIIFYDTYYYIVSTKNSTTVDCATRVSIKGADGSSASVTIVDNLNSDSSTSVLSAKQGKVLNTNKVETSAISTSFGSPTSDSKVPSENLVKTELDKKITKSNSATGLLKDDGTVMTSGTGSTNWAVGNHTHNPTSIELTNAQIQALTNIADNNTSNQEDLNENINSWIGSLDTNKVSTSKIANNLTTTTSGYVLDARQGKELYDMIGSAITYITGSGS